MTETAPVPFTLDELWVLQGAVRHEQAQPWQGMWPAYSLSLNDEIARGIIFCIDNLEGFYTIPLSRGDCLCIDATVSKDIKDANGKLIGKKILEKSFRARLAILDGFQLMADEPDDDGKIARLGVYRKATEQ